MITVIGGLGAIGNRYCKILDMMGLDYNIVDTGTMDAPVGEDIIITTPTPTHIDYINRFSDSNILCEKPVSLTKEEIEPLLNKANIRMVSNWLFFPGINPNPQSNLIHYDYFMTGQENDRCNFAQPYYLADKEKSTFRNKSTIFSLIINGEQVSLEDVQSSYLEMLGCWLMGDYRQIWSMGDAYTMANVLSQYPED